MSVQKKNTTEVEPTQLRAVQEDVSILHTLNSNTISIEFFF